MKRHTFHQPRWQNRPSARSLLLTVLGEFVYPAGRPVPTRAFVAALAAVGEEEGSTRQALQRSAAAGWLRSRRNGRETWWELTRESRRILESGTERIFSFGRRERSGGERWLLLHVRVPEGRRELRHRLRTGLQWAGFGAASPGVWLGPDPARESEAAAVLHGLGLRGRATSFVGEPGALGSVSGLVERAWDVRALSRRYQRFLDEFAGLRPREPAATFAALTMLVHRWRSFPFVDPGLPEHLLPRPWIGRRAAARFYTLHARWLPGARGFWAQVAR